MANLARPFSGGTNAASGMALAIQWLSNTTLWESSNLIMDVFTDGTGDAGSDAGQRNAAAVITVNGLAIDDRTFFLDGCGPTGYMTQNIITAGGLCFQAARLDDFERAVLEKIQAETSGPSPILISAPGSLALLSLGFFALDLYRKNK